MKTLILLGDSVLARTHQDGATALIPRLEKAYPDADVICHAVGGYNSRETLEMAKGISLPPKSIVVISLGLNDAAPWKQVPLDEFRDNYEQIMQLCAGHDIVLVAPNPVDTKKQQPPGRDNALISQYVEAIVALAQRYNAKVVNLFQIIGKAMKERDCFVADGLHLNDAGYSLLFEEVCGFIRYMPLKLKGRIERKPPKNQKYYLIAIDGRGGSGKTELLKYVSQLLPGYTFINGDDYFEPDNSTIAWGAFNEQRFSDEVVRPLQRGDTILHYRPYDWHTEPHIKERELHITKGVVTERSYSFAFDLNWDLKIWVDVPKELARDRGIERDGMPREQSIRQWEEVWQPKEDEHMATTKPLETADIVIDGTKPFEDQLG